MAHKPLILREQDVAVGRLSTALDPSLDPTARKAHMPDASAADLRGSPMRDLASLPWVAGAWPSATGACG